MKTITTLAAVLVVLAATPVASAATAGAPTITSIDPGSAATQGQQRVLVRGTGFTDVQSVTFGTAPGRDLTVLSPGLIRVIVPGYTEALVTVRVHTGHGTSAATNSAHFRYLSPVTGTLDRQRGPLPAGTTDYSADTRSKPACPQQGDCFDVGTDLIGADVGDVPVVRRLHDGAWTAARLPLPADAAYPNESTLNAISCGALDWCAGVGTYTATGGQQHALIETRHGSTWTARRAPVVTDLLTVSCVGTSFCAAGGRDDATTQSPMAVVTVTPQGAMPARFADGSDVVYAPVLSCSSATFCGGLGARNSDGSTTRVGLRYDGTSWTAQPIDVSQFGPVYLRLLGVDCAVAGRCVGIASTIRQGKDIAAFLTLYSGHWTIKRAPAPSDLDARGGYRLQDISCAAENFCTAVGYYESASSASYFDGLILRHYDGRWHALAAPAPRAVGRFYQLSGVSCAARWSCLAVGTYDTAPHGGRLLFDELNRGVWAASGLTPPRGANEEGKSAGLDSVDCAAPRSCAAVGAFDTDNDVTFRSVFATER